MNKNLMKQKNKINSTVVENSRYFYIGDHLGSSAWVCDYQGNPLQHLRYYPYGEILLSQKASGSTYDSDYKFNAKPLDTESGFYNYGARMYDPALGIWLSVDPLSEKYPSLSPFSYCAGNPVNLYDPDGRDIWLVANSSGKQQNIQKGNAVEIINRLASSSEGQQYVDRFINSSTEDIYITFGNTNGAEGTMYRNLDNNRNIVNSETVNFNGMDIQIDNNKTNYFVTLNEDYYGKTDIVGNNSESNNGAKTLGHEIGAHANNPSLGEQKEHGAWGQSKFGDRNATKGSNADKLNKSINSVSNTNIKENYILCSVII